MGRFTLFLSDKKIVTSNLGENVVINWIFLEPTDNVIIKKNCTNCKNLIASYILHKPKLLQNRMQIVSFPNPRKEVGLKIHNITLDDAGLYYVETTVDEGLHMAKTGMMFLLVLGRYYMCSAINVSIMGKPLYL